jgi:hypothetical protein
MKPNFILLLCSVILGITACKKDIHLPTDVANVTVVHTLVDVPSLLVNTSGKTGVWKALTDSYTGKVAYGAILGNPFKTATAKGLKIVSATDTLGSIYQASPDFSPLPGDLYTLLLGGNIQTPESILIKENLVVKPDSATGVRFINFGQHTKSIKVNIKDSNTTEATRLNYKTYTDFKVFDANYKHPNYIFEFRDEETNTLLLTYTFVVARTYNVSLVLRGIQGVTGTNGLAITRVNHY